MLLSLATAYLLLGGIGGLSQLSDKAECVVVFNNGSNWGAAPARLLSFVSNCCANEHQIPQYQSILALVVVLSLGLSEALMRWVFFRSLYRFRSGVVKLFLAFKHSDNDDPSHDHAKEHYSLAVKEFLRYHEFCRLKGFIPLIVFLVFSVLIPFGYSVGFEVAADTITARSSFVCGTPASDSAHCLQSIAIPGVYASCTYQRESKTMVYVAHGLFALVAVACVFKLRWLNQARRVRFVRRRLQDVTEDHGRALYIDVIDVKSCLASCFRRLCSRLSGICCRCPCRLPGVLYRPSNSRRDQKKKIAFETHSGFIGPATTGSTLKFAQDYSHISDTDGKLSFNSVAYLMLVLHEWMDGDHLDGAWSAYLASVREPGVLYVESFVHNVVSAAAPYVCLQRCNDRVVQEKIKGCDADFWDATQRLNLAAKPFFDLTSDGKKDALQNASSSDTVPWKSYTALLQIDAVLSLLLAVQHWLDGLFSHFLRCNLDDPSLLQAFTFSFRKVIVSDNNDGAFRTIEGWVEWRPPDGIDHEFAEVAPPDATHMLWTAWCGLRQQKPLVSNRKLELLKIALFVTAQHKAQYCVARYGIDNIFVQHMIASATGLNPVGTTDARSQRIVVASADDASPDPVGNTGVQEYCTWLLGAKVSWTVISYIMSTYQVSCTLFLYSLHLKKN